MSAAALIRQALRGEAPRWPQAGPDASQFMQEAIRHGVEPLLYPIARSLGWPADITDRLRAIALGRAAWESQHARLLREVLCAFEANDVPSVLLKGTALAYCEYPEPALRTRADTDVLVPAAVAARAQEMLRGCGFAPVAASGGDFASTQSTYVRQLADGTSHMIDLHWAANNSAVLAHGFAFEALLARSRPLAALAPQARAPGRLDSLLFACMHRASHLHNPYHTGDETHTDADRLVWLYDIHLLVRDWSAADWDDFIRAAAGRDLMNVSGQALARAREELATPVPQAVLDRCLQAGNERPARYLASGALSRAWMDWRALPRTSARVRWLREVLLPPREYMRLKYGRQAPLLWLYARRAAHGLARRLANGSSAQ